MGTISLLMAALATAQSAPAGPADSLRGLMLARIARDSGAVVAVALRDPVTGFMVLINPDRRFHAASTMKVPVLVELARRVDARELRWSDLLPIRNQFGSIVDGSPYTLSASDDSDSTVYAALGTSWPLERLAERMIVRSSNLAANLLIDRLGPARITRTLRTLGIDSMAVLRGVEDGKAYDRGLNNTTTARDLATLLLAIEGGRAASKAGTAVILGMLERQELNDGIPAGLPPGTRVAHKTGSITATWHDAALVNPGGGRSYALVVLSQGIPEQARGMALQADLARMAHAAVLGVRSRGRAP